MEFGALTEDFLYSSRDVPTASSDFCRVLEQMRILDEAEGQRVCETKDAKLDKKKSKKDKEKTKTKSNGENNNKFWRSKKSQSPRAGSPNSRDSLVSEITNSSLLSNQTQCKCDGTASLGKPRETVRAQFSAQNTRFLGPPNSLEIEEFRQRSKSDCSALAPHKRVALAVAERISPLESLHVHWPDERRGASLTTTLRPRSFSHGATGMHQKPILKKGSSGSLKPEYF